MFRVKNRACVWLSMNAVLPSFVIFMFDVYIEQMFSILFSFLVLNNKSVARSTRSIWNVNIANRLNLVTAILSPPPTLCHQCRLKTQIFFLQGVHFAKKNDQQKQRKIAERGNFNLYHTLWHVRPCFSLVMEQILQKKDQQKQIKKVERGDMCDLVFP